MTGCKGCGEELDAEKICCGTCEILIPHIIGQQASSISGNEFANRVRQSLGNPNTTPYQIWRRIRGLPGKEGDWILGAKPADERECIVQRPEPWQIDPNQMDLLNRDEWHVPSIMELRELHRGGALPDGSHLSWNSGTFYLEGIPIRLPYRGLSKMLIRHRSRDDIDWRKLLLSVDLAVRAHKREPWNELDGVIHPVCAFISGGVEIPFSENGRGAAERTQQEFHQFQIKRGVFNGTEWMRRWHRDVPIGKWMAPLALRKWELSNVPVTLSVRRGRLQLRVRRNSAWRRIELDSDPMLWAKVVTWALSPPDHEDRKRLHCIQQHIFADEGKPLICGSDLKGINFLRKVVESSERVKIEREKRAIKVIGTSGLSYRVTPGKRGHGTRFTVSPFSLNGGKERDPDPMDVHPRWRHHMHQTALCIVEQPELRRLVIGDAISSIVLALLDDLNSQREIYTLRSHIQSHGPRDPHIESINEVRFLRDRLRDNDLERRVRRCSRLFPRLWSVLLRSPLGERMTFTAMHGGRPNISFDDCDTEFTTTSMVERSVIYAMLEAAGWVRDLEEDRVRGSRRNYIRIGTGNRDLGDAVADFCELLEPILVIGDRIRILVAPLWTHFERANPGTAELLPGTNQRIE